MDEDEIDLRELLGLLVDRKWLIAGVTGVFFLGALLYALLATPVYRAQAMVQVESKTPSLPGLPDLSSLGAGDLGSKSEATTEIALITSRTVIGNAADALKLDIAVEPYRFPLLGKWIARGFKPTDEQTLAPPKLGLSRYGWGGETLSIYRLEVPDDMLDTELTLKTGDSADHFELLDEDGDLLLKGKVGDVLRNEKRRVAIQVETLHANPGTRFHVSKLRRLNLLSELQKKVGAGEQGRDSGILQLSYEHEDPLFAQDFLQEVAQAYVLQNVERNSAEATSQLKFVKEQLPSVRQQVETAQDAMNAYQTKAHSVDITMQTKGLLEQEVAVETSIQQLRLKQAEMDRSYTPEHPAYRALVRQIGELEQRKSGFQGQVNKLPDTQKELLRLTRDLTVSNELYSTLLSQAQQLDVARAGTVGNVRIIDPAAVDVLNPVKPRKPLIVLVGLLLGAFLSTGWVLLQRMLNRGIEDPSQIEELGLPVYASIPASSSSDLVELVQHRRRRHEKHDDRQRLLAVNEPADLAVEAIRSLRTSLHFAMLEAKNNILSISGPRPGVGKTFVSTNLAAIVAQANQRVVLIDADMRKGTVHKVMGVSAQNGLSDVLAGKIGIKDALRKATGVDGMDYLVRGDIPPNPAELLMHPHFSSLLKTLSEQYDLVIVDTPPILAVTDPAIVGQLSGTNLLVTRFGINQTREILLAKNRFEQNGVHLKGAIFNGVERRANGYYSYGYYEYKSKGEDK